MSRGDAWGKATTLGVPLAPDAGALAERTARILASAQYTNSGPTVAEFEEALAAALGARHAVATSSGTVALTMTLLSLDLPDGAEVITTPLTFPATVHAIEAAGLRPVFAAVDGETLTLDPDAVAAAVSPRTGAILPVHLFGVACDPLLDEVAGAIPVVYDAAHAFDSGDHGRSIARRGSMAAYSLHATKLLHCGEGGVVVTDDADRAARLRAVRNFSLDSGIPRARGVNGKLPELSAALGLSVLPAVAEEERIRRGHRETYRALFATSDRVDEHAPGRPAAVLFQPVRCAPEDQTALLADLAARGIIARSFPPLTDPRSHYRGVPLVGTTADALATLAHSCIALPLHSAVPAHHFDAVAEALGVV